MGVWERAEADEYGSGAPRPEMEGPGVDEWELDGWAHDGPGMGGLGSKGSGLAEPTYEEDTYSEARHEEEGVGGEEACEAVHRGCGMAMHRDADGRIFFEEDNDYSFDCATDVCEEIFDLFEDDEVGEASGFGTIPTAHTHPAPTRHRQVE